MVDVVLTRDTGELVLTINDGGTRPPRDPPPPGIGLHSTMCRGCCSMGNASSTRESASSGAAVSRSKN